MQLDKYATHHGNDGERFGNKQADLSQQLKRISLDTQGVQRKTQRIKPNQSIKKGIKSEEQQCGWLWFVGFDARRIDQSPLHRLTMQWKSFQFLNTVEGGKYCCWVEEIQKNRKNHRTILML